MRECFRVFDGCEDTSLPVLSSIWPSSARQRFVAGEHNVLPADCGGIPGFYELLNAIADPRHPSHAEAKEWLDNYDPTSSTRC
jgi:hypothetical protein